MEGKKIRYRSDFEVLTSKEMQQHIGGYEGSGTYDDPYQLPEVVIIYNPCRDKSYKEECSFGTFKGRCCRTFGTNNLICSNVGDLAC